MKTFLLMIILPLLLSCSKEQEIVEKTTVVKIIVVAHNLDKADVLSITGNIFEEFDVNVNHNTITYQQTSNKNINYVDYKINAYTNTPSTFHIDIYIDDRLVTSYGSSCQTISYSRKDYVKF